MSALGHKRTYRRIIAMSALPPKADIQSREQHVCFGANSGHFAIHSITSSASASTDGSTVRPRAFELFSRNEGPTAHLYRQHDLLKARWDAAWPELPPQATTDDCRRANDSRAATLKRLAQDAYELDAFKPNLTRTEAEKRIAMLTAKLKLLDGPPHTL